MQAASCSLKVSPPSPLIKGAVLEATATTASSPPTRSTPQPVSTPCEVRLAHAEQAVSGVAPEATDQRLAQLKERIAQVCAGSARDVTVQPGSGNSLRISLKVRDLAIGARLGNELTHMPELAPYNVYLQIPVEP
jgi:hypothetical protein